MATVLVQNELLAYVFDVLNRDNNDDIEEVLLNFYGDEAVKDAKVLIWKEYVNSLPAWQDRRNTTATIKQKEVADILSAVRTIDEKFSADDEIPVTFAAVKLKNIPDKRYTEEMSVRNRIQVLELQMAEVLAKKLSTYATTPVTAPQWQQ